MNKSLNTNLLQLWSYGEAKFKSENWTINRVTYSLSGKVVAYVQILEKNFLKLFHNMPILGIRSWRIHSWRIRSWIRCQ